MKNAFYKPLMIIPLLASISGCDFIYGLLDKEGAEEKKIIGEVVPFEKNPTVEEIQTLLKLYGYNSGKVDGVLGLQTREAIARFQRDNNLEETRFCDDKTWEKLRIFKDNGFIVEGALNIKKLQASLLLLGYDVGKVDGKTGPKTIKAVLKFQKDNNLKVDGKVGYKTLNALITQLPTDHSLDT